MLLNGMVYPLAINLVSLVSILGLLGGVLLLFFAFIKILILYSVSKQ